MTGKLKIRARVKQTSLNQRVTQQNIQTITDPELTFLKDNTTAEDFFFLLFKGFIILETQHNIICDSPTLKSSGVDCALNNENHHFFDHSRKYKKGKLLDD